MTDETRPLSVAEQAAQDEADDIASLFPQPVQCTMGKVSLSIMPMDADHCFDFINKIEPIIRSALGGASFKDAFKEATIELLLPQIMTAAASHKKAFFEALAAGTGRTPQFIGKLPWTFLIAIATTVFSVNIDFFNRSVGDLAPDVKDLLQKAGTSGAGPMH